MSADLVVFGEDWGRHPSSTQHLVRRLAADRRVLWVNSIGMRRPRLTRADLGRAARKLVATRSSAVAPREPAAAPPPGMTLASPLVVPWPGSRAAFAANRILLSRQLTQRMAATGVSRPLLWTSLPTALPAVGQLGERGLVYYCGDDFGALAGVDHEPVLDMERRLVDKADLVLAASPALAARFPSGKTLLTPHGADIDLFSRAAPRAEDLPAGGPIAGFYGSLSDWIDVELLSHAASRLPGWRFVIVGPVDTDVTALRRLDNVVFLGRREHAELPSYAQHWTVSLLPFRDNAQIRACNPLKLREYLAAGRPIVSTDFPALDPYRDLITVATTPEAFTAAIGATIDAPDRTAARRGRVAGETWDARARDVARALEAI